MKQKTCLVILMSVVLAVCLVSASYPSYISAISSDLEIIYPSLPSVVTPTTIRTALPNYIKYIFTLAMVLSGLIVFGVFLAAGLRYLTSAGNPGAVNESKNRMISAFLGAIIILSSYLILNTVNPKISLIEINKMGPTELGVTFLDASGNIEFNTSVNVPDFALVGLDSSHPPIKVKFLSHEVEVTPCYTLNDFTESSCNSNGTIKLNEDEPVNTVKPFPSSAKAAKLFWPVYGVYAYADPNLKGDLRIYDGRYATLGDFNDKISSTLTRNPPGARDYRTLYDAVLFKEEGFKGGCKFAGYQPVPQLGHTWDNNVGSLITFRYREDHYYAGGSVKFYKNENYQNDYGYSVEQNYVDTTWKNFSLGHNEGIYSLKIDGNYLVVLAENNASYAAAGNTGKCEVFFTSDSNLNDNQIGQCHRLNQCNPGSGCFQIGNYCPYCTASCARSFRVIPIYR